MESSDAIHKNVLGAALSETDTVSALLSAVQSSYRVKSEKLYNYCKEHYYYGLPEGSAVTDTSIGTNLQKIIAILETEEGVPIEIVTAQSGTIVPEMYIEHFKATVLLVDDSTGVIGGYTHEGVSAPLYYDSAVFNDESNMRVLMHYFDVNSTQVDLVVLVPIPTINSTSAYYSVKYEISSSSEVKYWFYEIGSGLYPSIEETNSAVADSVFMPIVSIKNNKDDIIDSEIEELRKTTNTATKIVGFDLETITDAINDTENNPDAELVDDAFITYTLDINTESDAGIKYMYEFFDLMDQSIKVGDKALYDEYIENNGKYTTCMPVGDGGEFCTTHDMPYNLNILNVTDGQFNTRIGWNYIDKVLVTGSVGYVGSTTVERNVLPSKTIVLEDLYDPRVYRARVLEQSYIVLRRQLTDDSYIEMTVHGLEHATDIDGRGIVTQTLETSQDNNLFYLPVAHSIIEQLNSVEVEELYRETVGLIIYAIKGTKLEWYESKTFMFLLQVVIIAVSIILAQPQLAAINLTTTAGVLALVETAAINFLIVKAAEVIIKELGLDSAFVTALLAAAAAAYTGYTGDTLFTLSAEVLLDVVVVITTASSNVVEAESLELLKEEEEFLKSVEDKQEELDATKDMLGTTDDYLLGTVTRTTLMPSTGIDGFYNLAIGTSNTDIIIGSVTGYVDNALQLPNTLQ